MQSAQTMKSTATRSIRRFLLSAIFVAAACAIPCAMAADEKKEGEGEKKPKEVKKTLFQTLEEGGIVMIPLAICSFFMVYLAGDGFMRTQPKRFMPPEQIEAIKNFFRQGNYQGAYDYCKANPTPTTNVLRVGISLLGEGKEIVENAMGEELGKENSHVQTKMSYLSVIGVCTPMIGLVGTVTGMIKAFGSLGSSGLGDPSGLSAAIGEVLVATASGLFVAIPAFGMFYYVKARATGMVHDISDLINTLFRAMPYKKLEGKKYGDEEIFASAPPEEFIACPACGGENYADATECAHCGQSLAAAAPAAVPASGTPLPA